MAQHPRIGTMPNTASPSPGATCAELVDNAPCGGVAVRMVMVVTTRARTNPLAMPVAYPVCAACADAGVRSRRLRVVGAQEPFRTATTTLPGGGAVVSPLSSGVPARGAGAPVRTSNAGRQRGGAGRKSGS